jgi:1-acyl-sn-glycerol-3-phosphate acyltransferase
MKTIKKIKDNVVSVLVYMSAGMVFGIGVLFLLLLSFIHTGALFEWLFKKLCKNIVRSAGIRVKLEGKEHFDPQKQYIVMMNHVNLFDGMLLYGNFPGKGRAVEEESHFNWILYGWFIRRLGFIPINRKSGIKAMAALKRAGDLIKERKNFSVAILPEGTRTRTGKLGNFKKGGFLIALEAGLDILPVVQIGSFEIKQKPNWLVRPGKVRLVITEAIATAGYSKDNIDELMQKTRQRYLEYVD